jgi:two-component system response regulator YesN
LKQHGLDLTDGYYVSGNLEIENSNGDNELVSLEKLRTLTEELLHIYFQDKPLTRLFIVQDGVFFIIKSNEKHFMKKVDAFLYELLQSAEQYLALRIRAGISNLFETITNLPLAYKEAKQAIGYGKFLNSGRIVYIGEVENKKTMVLALSLDDVNAIETTIKFGTDSEVKEIFKSRKAAVKASKDFLIDYEAYIVSLANIIIHYAHSMKADTDDILGKGLLEEMLALSDLDQVFDFTESIIFKLRSRNIEKNISRTEKILYQALNIIETRYYDPNLSLNQVCDEIDISISYLSMLFQRQHNMTFNKYLIQTRMEHAKELLIRSHDKIINIATKCGYNEVYYFSHSFKKYTGLSPKQYREKYHV